MLSQPSCYLVGSLARNPSSISSSTCYGPFPPMRCLLTREIKSWLFFSYRYQIPSQPTRMKSSSLHSYTAFTSGCPLIVCLWYSRAAFFLQQMSPRLRDRFRWLFMRPPSTLHPEDTMRYSSSGFYGLWSCDSSMVSSLRLRAARESPTLATYSVLPTRRQTFAVQPTESATLPLSKGWSPFRIVMSRRRASPRSLRRMSSIPLKVSYSARAQFPF